MKSIRYKLMSTGSIIVLLLTLSVAGCAHTGARTGFQVIPLSNQNVVALSADDIVQVMQRAGFSDEQILKLGTDLHNALSQSGAAQLKIRNKIEAIFAVHGNYIYISTRLRGSFIFNTKEGWVGSPLPRS